MTQVITRFRIFVASPKEVSDERVAIKDVIDELNQTFGNSNTIFLELIKWETHSAPGISNKGSQSVINQDIGEDYDLFIGILWTKFGSPTQNADSGTQEEFEIAYDKYKKSPNTVQILFYFKNLPPITLNEIDPGQLLKVQEFKNSLGTKGIIFWEFGTIEDFQKFLRIHIPKRVKQLLDMKDSRKKEGLNPSEIEEELGLIDYHDVIAESFKNARNGVERITDSMNWLSEEITRKAEEANKLSPNTSKSILRDFFKRTAKTLNDFANRIEPDIEIFFSNYEEGIDAISKLINISKTDFQIEQTELEEIKLSLVDMNSGIVSGMNGVITLLEAVSKLPKIEKEVNRARRNVESKLDSLINKMKVSITLSQELEKEL